MNLIFILNDMFVYLQLKIKNLGHTGNPTVQVHTETTYVEMFCSTPSLG